MKNKERRKLIRLFSGIIVVIFIATIISICIGKYSIALTDIWSIICGNENVSLLSRKVFFTLRLPRTFMAIMAGTGLGLAIVKHIIQQHGAHMELTSEKGKGTKIEIEFSKSR